MGKILVVAHHHLRPGGVRRVIETTLPALAAAGRMDRIVLALGEPPPPHWIHTLHTSLQGTPVETRIHPEFLYLAEQNATHPPPQNRLDALCTAILENAGATQAVLWTHNPALGRNLPLAKAWTQAARTTGAILVFHHHDFFFDNRWHLWNHIRQTASTTLEEAAETVFPHGKNIIHLLVNRRDLQCLSQGLPHAAFWIPNPAPPATPSAAERKSACEWMASRLGTRAPYWLLPGRLLRRKNIAEAVLLARWLRPRSRLATTGGASSAGEFPYARRLAAAAAEHCWNLDLAVLENHPGHPPVPALIASAGAVLFPSLMEGFGLPCLEAASAERPLLARSLPNVMPDLLAMGLHAPLAYREILVPPDAWDSKKELHRQRALWESWRSTLPPPALEFCEEPLFLRHPGEPVPFSRLTFPAQVEILSHTPATLHAMLSGANPELAALHDSRAVLPPASLDPAASETLSPARFAEKFHSAVQSAPLAMPAATSSSPDRALQAFLRDRLASSNLYPLLFSTGI